jgi:hypothetical protein
MFALTVEEELSSCDLTWLEKELHFPFQVHVKNTH